MKSFLRTLLRPDREETNPEAAEVAQAANILQIGEFQLLQLAYRDWHSAELPETLTDKLFACYMLRKQVPHWTRHYARRIIDWNERNILDADNRDYHRHDRAYGNAAPGGGGRSCIATVVLVFFVGRTLWLSQLATEGGSGSILPPYFDTTEQDPARRRGAVGPGS